jgi:hypothetical protein
MDRLADQHMAFAGDVPCHHRPRVRHAEFENVIGSLHQFQLRPFGFPRRSVVISTAGGRPPHTAPPRQYGEIGEMRGLARTLLAHTPPRIRWSKWVCSRAEEFLQVAGERCIVRSPRCATRSLRVAKTIEASASSSTSDQRIGRAHQHCSGSDAVRLVVRGRSASGSVGIRPIRRRDSL